MNALRTDTSRLQSRLACFGAIDFCKALGIDAHGNARQARANCPMCGGSESLSVHSREKLVWKCHSQCGGGDAIALTMHLLSVSFLQAVTRLEELVGETTNAASTQIAEQPRISDESFHTIATSVLAQSHLEDCPDAIAYLKALGIHEESTKDQWGAFKWAENTPLDAPPKRISKDQMITAKELVNEQARLRYGVDLRSLNRIAFEHLLNKQFGWKALRSSGLFRSEKGESGQWKCVLANPDHGILIPWRAPDGRIQTLQMRYVGTPPNGAPKVVWPRSRGAQWPYGIEQVISQIGDRTIPLEFVEGAKDTLARRMLLRRRGVHRLVLGLPSASASLRAEWCEWLKDREVFVALDSDEAGQKAAKQIAQQAQSIGAKRVVLATPKNAKDWTESLGNTK